MDRVRLGRCGLEVSAAALGCGGHSRLGQLQGKSVEESIRLVHQALELGITYFDTAHQYGTEEIMGLALKGERDEVVVSTKARLRDRDAGLVSAKEMRKSVETSLRRLGTGTIDVFHLHAVARGDYDHAVGAILPELERLRQEGAIRFLAISENPLEDPNHEMLFRAVADNCFDVIMAEFNVFPQSARRSLLPAAIEKDIGVEVMGAIRHFVLPYVPVGEAPRAEGAEQRIIDMEVAKIKERLSFLVHDADASSLLEAGLRFCRHEPGCHVVLTGTGDAEHLRANVAAINRGPLNPSDLEQLAALADELSDVAVAAR